MKKMEIAKDKAWMINFPDALDEFFKSHLIDGKRYRWLGKVEVNTNGIYLIVEGV